MPLPGNVDLITVTGTFKFIDDTVPTGEVTFRPSGDPWLKDASADTTLVPKTVTCTINASGQIVGPGTAVGEGGVGVKLPATNDPDLSPNGFVYDVVVKLGGVTEQAYAISLPTGTPTVDLADLAPVTPVTGSGVPVVTSVDGVVPSATGAVVLNAKRIKTPLTLSDTSGTISTDASLADVFRVVLTGNRTLANPTGAYDGQMLRWEITQDATGGRTLALGSKFVFGTDLPSLTLSTTPAKTDILGAQYDAADDVWRVLALSKGY